MKTSVKKLPANLNVSVGKKEETHANRFTGEEINLDPMDAAVYKAVMLADYLASMFADCYSVEAQNCYDIVRSGNSYFRRYNAKAYMVLLD
jgi:hypothetical protein